MHEIMTTMAPEAVPDGKPILITAEELAARLSLSKRTIYRLLSAGAMVKPIRLRGIVRWRAAEVEEWIAAGCPDCRTWKSSFASQK